MRVEKISFEDTGLFSDLFLQYINQSPKLAEFYDRFPSLHSFEAQINEKRESFDQNRALLQRVLNKQYEGLSIQEGVDQNLKLLARENTFTITTGHQLNIFTGPLYFIYKILTVIKTCERLSREYPESNFVPVYWMASEDHDLEEISFCKLFGKKYSWDTDQTGAVGRMNPQSLMDLVEEMPGKNEVFRDAYSSYDNLADSVRCYVNALFGHYGLVVIDADDPELKASMIQVFSDDLLENQSKKLVDKTSEQLNDLGYKPQVVSRDINLFYLEGNSRERIVATESGFEVLNTELKFTGDEILKVLEEHPDRFSPNVILRPLYQEMILPNLAYVGGPAELVYWLQLKSLFDFYKVPFPILQPRNFVLYANHVTTRKFSKTAIGISQLFDDPHQVINEYVKSNSNNSLELNEERQQLEGILKDLNGKASSVDPTLEAMVSAEQKKIIRSLSKVEDKMLKAEKRKFQDFSNQVQDVWGMLFPDGAQQERSQNFLNFYLDEPSFIDNVKELIDPLDLSYHILFNDQNE